jgi:predicted MFS family arabinose efflux permease
MLAVVPMLFALSWGGRVHAWSSPIIVGCLSTSAVMTLLFLWVEHRAAEPIIPPALFHHSVVTITIVATVLTSAGMYGTLLFVPLFIQAVLGTGATQSGAVLTPMMVSMVLSSLAAGQLLARVGKYRVLAISGVAVATVGMGLLATMGPQASYGTIVRNMVVIGFGLGVTMPIFPLAVQNAVPYEIVGVASAASQFFRSMGGALGSAVFGALLANRFAPSFQAALPSHILQAIPASALEGIENPQALFNPELAGAIQQAIAIPGAPGRAVAQQVLAAIRAALATSLQDVFVASTCIMIAATLILLLLKDIPLRRSNRTAPRTAES